MLEAVIFDYGGVISSPLFRGIGRFEADMGYPPGAILELLFGETAYIGLEGRALAGELPGPGPTPSPAVTHDWHRLEIGEIGLEEYLAGVQARAPEVLGKPLDLEAYARFTSDMPVGVHWMVVHKIRDLRAGGYRVGLLTNNVAEWGAHWRATFPVDELFEVVVDSSAVGLRKPDPRIYRLTCEQLGVDPRSTAFVDDNHDNVAAARALGMTGVHFGADPWEALAELDAALAASSRRSAS
ncbi:MAG: HAD family phosphatase [Acidimicrobiia bacterium]